MSDGLIYIVVRFQFEGWHRWPEATGVHSYLANAHRHMFHVEARKVVSHGNREVEIIELKETLKTHCETLWGRMPDGTPPKLIAPSSCEHIAERLCRDHNLSSCIVLEDGENGAEFVTAFPFNVVGPSWEAQNGELPKNYHVNTFPDLSGAMNDAVSMIDPVKMGAAAKAPVTKPPSHVNAAVTNKMTPYDDEEMEEYPDESEDPEDETEEDDDDVGVHPVKRRFEKTLFTGIEAEGPHRHIPTLFVPGDAPIEKIFQYAMKNKKRKWELRNLYLGADNYRITSVDDIQPILERMDLFDHFNFIFVETEHFGICQDIRKWMERWDVCLLERVFTVLVMDKKRALPKSSNNHNCVDFWKMCSPTQIIWTENARPGECQSWATYYDDELFNHDKAAKI